MLMNPFSGAAIGVAVAFNAPIGGLLFAFEEVSSFFSTALGWQTFFGAALLPNSLILCFTHLTRKAFHAPLIGAMLLLLSCGGGAVQGACLEC